MLFALNTGFSMQVTRDLIGQMIIKVNSKGVNIALDDITGTIQAKSSRYIGNLTLRRANEVMNELTNWILYL